MKTREIFYSIQGEGKNSGQPSVFVRLTGCNLRCNYCDSTYAFDVGQKMSVSEIMAEVKKYNCSWVCLTGGEPFLQDLGQLISSLKQGDFKVQIETNGTIFQPIECDWLVVSPKRDKAPDKRILQLADEIKLVVDSEGALKDIEKFESWGRVHFVQPVSNDKELTKLCVNFAKRNPKWQISMQVHKFIGVK